MLKKSRAGSSFFYAAVLLAAGLLVAATALFVSAQAEFLLPQNTISVLNLLVDVVVGVLTIWALFWAATEFAQSRVEPELHVAISPRRTEVVVRQEMPNRDEPLDGLKPADGGSAEKGSDSYPRVGVDLHVKNTRQKPASRLRIELSAYNPRVPLGIADPCLEGQVPILHSEKPQTKFIQWGVDPVVYEGCILWLGGFDLLFLDGSEPDDIVFEYKLYCLEGSKPLEGKSPHRITWRKRSPTEASTTNRGKGDR